MDNVRLFGSTNDSSGVLSRFEIDRYRNEDALIPERANVISTFLAHYDTSIDADYAKGAKTGTPENGATITSTGMKFGAGALDLSVASRVYYASAANFPTNAGTIELWVKPVNTNGNYFTNNCVLVQSYDGNNFVIASGDPSYSFGVFVVSNGVNLAYVTGYTLSWTNAVWHHVAASWGSNGLRLYVDGLLMATTPYTGHLFLAPYFWIGGKADWNAKSYANVDELRILDVQLTPAQVLYDCKTTRPFVASPAGTLMSLL